MIKIEKSNNPAAVGALVLVLVLIVGRILWMVLGHTETASAASPAPTPAPPPTVSSAPAAQTSAPAVATPLPSAKPHPTGAVPLSTRNPFAAFIRPVSVPTRPERLASPSGEAPRIAARGGDTSLGSLPPMPFQVTPTGGRGEAQPTNPLRGSGPPPSLPNPVGKQPDQTPDLKLTAIIDGAEPMAIVQTSNPQPVTLHVGDLIEGMRVTAIHEQSVVFARGTGHWTLSLQSAADITATGPISVTTAAQDAAPAISVVTPEENTDEKH